MLQQQQQQLQHIPQQQTCPWLINTHIMQLQQNKKKINKINKQNGMLTLITIPQQ